MAQYNMTPGEARSTCVVAILMGFRLLGLFMILPVFTLYGQSLAGATATTLGIALGIYGFTQACLQIPFGALSDRFGRRSIITLGLLGFALGSLVAALSTSITGLILGRALQGAGAIGSPCLAYLADVTRPQVRTRAMALVGMVIGVFFMMSMVLGPLAAHWSGGLQGIFLVTLLLGLLGACLGWFTLSSSTQPVFTLSRNHITAVLGHPALRRLNSGVFITHALFTACFIPIPLLLTALTSKSHLGAYYLALMGSAFCGMLPVIIWAEKHKQSYRILRGALLLLGVAPLFLMRTVHWLPGLLAVLWLFFGAFNALEALLPALVSRHAPAGSKGLTMGVYSTHQFLGIFVGGALGGWLYGHYDLAGIVGLCLTFSGLWWVAGFGSSKNDVMKEVVEQHN